MKKNEYDEQRLVDAITLRVISITTIGIGVNVIMMALLIFWI